MIDGRESRGALFAVVPSSSGSVTVTKAVVPLSKNPARQGVRVKINSLQAREV